jgi:RNA polymerase sigma-70 factor, ECF subfamily
MSRSQSLNFKKLVEAHCTGLYRFAYALVNDEQEACDLTQQTFYLYANNDFAVRDPAKARDWLFAMLWREFQRQRRASGRAPAPEAATPPETPAPALAPELVNPLDGASAAAALERVSEGCRAPLALFYLPDFSLAQIAEAIGVPRPELHARLARGKAQLKKSFLNRLSADAPDLESPEIDQPDSDA